MLLRMIIVRRNGTAFRVYENNMLVPMPPHEARKYARVYRANLELHDEFVLHF